MKCINYHSYSNYYYIYCKFNYLSINCILQNINRMFLDQLGSSCYYIVNISNPSHIKYSYRCIYCIVYQFIDNKILKYIVNSCFVNILTSNWISNFSSFHSNLEKIRFRISCTKLHYCKQNSYFHIAHIHSNCNSKSNLHCIAHI